MIPTHLRFFAGAVLAGGSFLSAQDQRYSLLRAPELTRAEIAARQTSALKTFERVDPAVVHVLVKVGGFFRVERHSSGVTIHPSGLVLTNLHLVRDAFDKNGVARPSHKVMIRTAKGVELPVEVLGQDADHDLALLQVEVPDGETLQAVELGDSRKVMLGETLLVVARPNERIYANFIGSASAAQGPIRLNKKLVAADKLLLADVNMKRQADGGAMFDINGRLLAIVNSSKVRPPAGKNATPEEKRQAKISFGFAMRVHVAFESFEKSLSRVKMRHVVGHRTDGLAGVVQRNSHAVVSVRRASVGKLPQPATIDPYGKFADDSICSGVIVDPSGLVLTSAHVHAEGDLTVTLPSGKSYLGKVIAKRPANNVMLVQLECQRGETLPFVPLGDSSTVILGERIVAIGNRYGHTVTANVGYLSSKPRTAEAAGQHKKSMGHFQTGAHIHNGNSGGPLLGRDGMLLGICDCKATIDKQEQEESKEAEAKTKDSTIGFAVPSNWIRAEFRKELLKLVDAENPLVTVPKVNRAERARRCGSRITRVVAKQSDCFLNVFVKAQKIGTKKTGFMSELFPEAADDKDFHLLGQGSGVIIDPTGLALTNWHVVDHAVYGDGAPRKDHKVFVSVGSGKKYEVEVLSTSRDDDLALLQLKLTDGERVQAIRLGDSDAIKVGETVIAIGNPHGFSNSVTAGVVSAKNRSIRIKGRARLFRGMVQTDAGINPGNSGGALIDLNGDLVGINNAGDHSQAKIGFAIPVNYVREKFHSTLLSSDKLRSVFLGLEASADQKGRLFVKSVTAYSPAVEAGVKVGDHLLTAQGQKLTNKVQFVKLARAAAPFAPFPVEVRRDGKLLRLTLQPLSDASWTIFLRAQFAVREVTMSDAGEQLKQAGIAAYREYTRDLEGKPSTPMQSGLMVTQVHPHAVTDGMDMQRGDVIIGIRKMVREIHLQDRHVLEYIRTLKGMRDFVRGNATKKGQVVELWTVRAGKVIKAQVFIKKPAAKK